MTPRARSRSAIALLTILAVALTVAAAPRAAAAQRAAVPAADLVLRNGMLRGATYGRGAFAFMTPTGPSIAVNLEHNLEFGTVCQGPQFLTLEIFNVGVADLVITSVQRLMGSTSFSVLATPGTPLVIAPGEHVDFTVRYNPTGTAPSFDIATIRITSNDPAAPVVDLAATGSLGTARLSTAIADAGSFGNVCLRSFVDKEFTINNSGTCPLRILNITSSSPEFLLPSVVSYPLVVAAGDSVALPVRFEPLSLGSKTASITIVSNDPAGIRIVAVSGFAPAPELDLIIANSGDFGNVCIGSVVDKPLTLLNSGRCTLTVTAVSSSASEFIVPNVLSYPIRIAPETAIEVPIRFEPASFGAKSGTITVTSDDPTGAKSVALSGNVPSGKLTVTGSTCIGGVKACCLGERTISICNVGDCRLRVTSVAFKRKSKHWKLINNPFPATLHPGSCLSVLIRYKATEKCPRCCELVITSDDPITPVKTLEVTAYTSWSDCGCKKCCDDCRKGCCEKRHWWQRVRGSDCGCKKCCDDCRKGCCEKRHHECCSVQSIDPCCFDEGDNHEDEDES